MGVFALLMKLQRYGFDCLVAMLIALVCPA